MLGVFTPVKSLTKFSKGKISIDNLLCRLHYKATVSILVASSLLVTVNLYMDKPIRCIVDEAIGGKVMDVYCWIHSTYTLPHRLSTIDLNAAHPGVASLNDLNDKDQVKYHTYYQWVCFVLLFQAGLFYIPRYLWKMWEGGRIKMLVMDLNCPIVDEESKMKKKELIVNYFVANIGRHYFYVGRFFLCEVAYCVNVVGQIFFMDMFLGFQFLNFGQQVLGFTGINDEERAAAISRVFPEVTKCTFKKFGPSGNVVPYDGICVLPINIINEKVYTFLWIWFVVLAVISAIGLVYRMLTLFVPKFRLYLLRTRAQLEDSKIVNFICSKGHVGDWFVLHQIGRNMEPAVFLEVMQDLSAELERRANI